MNRDIVVVAQIQQVAKLPSTLEEHPRHRCFCLPTRSAPTLPPPAYFCAESGGAMVLLLENNVTPQQSLRPYAECLLPRNVSSERLLESIRRVAAGKPCEDLEETSPDGNDPVGLRVRERLTVQELQIIGLVVQGLKNREVAASLHTQEQVVKNYLRSIYDKTGVSDRLELALFVLHHHVLADAAALSVSAPHGRAAEPVSTDPSVVRSSSSSSRRTPPLLRNRLRLRKQQQIIRAAGL